jgi:hypothetical protein
MTDTFEKATNNKEVAGMIRNFSDVFTKQLEPKNNVDEI